MTIIDKVENMNKRTKMILSLVGVCAVVVPALLLWYVSSHSRLEPQVNSSKRRVDTANVQTSSQNTPAATPRLASTPTPGATSSALPKQGTSSAR